MADVLRYLTYADGYGQFALGRERFLELTASRSAVRCGDCAECTVKCPHGVQVAEPHGARPGIVCMKAAGLLLTVLLAAGMARAQDYLNCNFVPGWEQSEPSRQYAADNLYDYKDGSAEGYLIYGFTRMEGITCKSGGDTLAIDVSEMNDADSAYGIFAANLDPSLPIAKIGMGGQIHCKAPALPRASTTSSWWSWRPTRTATTKRPCRLSWQGWLEQLEGARHRSGGAGVVPAREPRLHPPGP